MVIGRYESSGMATVEELTDSHRKGSFDLKLVATSNRDYRKPKGLSRLY